MMHEAVPIVFIVIGLPVICITIIALSKHKQKDDARRSREGLDRETEIIEEIYLGLKKLNRRIENLETILAEKRNRGKS